MLLELERSPAFCQNDFIDVIKKLLETDSTEEFQLLQIMYTLAPIIEGNNTIKYLWPTFLRLTKGSSHMCIVRQALVRTLGMFCRILGSEWLELRLWPIYTKLSKDTSWRVRQQCARILPIVSLFSTPRDRNERVAPLIKRFLRDPNRYVFLVASDMLGIYLATFASPRILTVHVNAKMELSLPNPADEDFKECLQKESEREKFASYERMFAETVDRHSYSAPKDPKRSMGFQEIFYPLDVGGRVLEKYIRLSKLPVKLHLAGSDLAHLRRELEDFFNNMSFDCWIMDFKNIISDRIKFEEGNLSEFFPYRPAVDEANAEEDERRNRPIPLPAPPPKSPLMPEAEEDDDSDEESSAEMEELLRDLQEEAPGLWQKLADAHSERKQARKAAAKCDNPEPADLVDEAEDELHEVVVPEPTPVASVAPMMACSSFLGKSTENADEDSQGSDRPLGRRRAPLKRLKRDRPEELTEIINKAIENNNKRKLNLEMELWNECKDDDFPEPPQTASIEGAPHEMSFPTASGKRATFAEVVSRGGDSNEIVDFNDNPSESCIVLDSTEESVMYRKNISEARKTLLVRSHAMCLSTSTDTNENWCCERLCDMKITSDDDDAKEFNSHNFWYIAPDAVSIDEICSEKSDISFVPSPAFDDTASLPMHNLSESPDDSGYREMDMEKTRLHMTDGYIDPALLKQDILPPDLLQNFISKANSDETDVSIACAYSFPAVALTLGRQNWHLLHRTLQKLCANQKVCNVVINSFPLIALIVGRENATNHLLPLYLRFFDNVARIRCEALKNAHTFLATVDESRHVDVIAKLPICLADFHKTNETKYHVRENFINVVLSLMHMYDRNDAPVDCVNYLTAYALAMLVDKVHHVRELALEALVVRVRTCNERDFGNLLQAVTEECGESTHWRNRQTFVRLVHRWVSEDFIDMRVFVRDILPRLLILSNDKVPNVRLVVGRCLYNTVYNHRHFLKASMEEEKTRIQEVIGRLECDEDVDVRESCGGVLRCFQYCDDAGDAIDEGYQERPVECAEDDSNVLPDDAPDASDAPEEDTPPSS
uniref:Protein phosphatase 4 regulatory subunit 1 n=1 Tax=Nyssomyia neivai TaxID=330878 RepID=A0A1L8DL54_9DIPT